MNNRPYKQRYSDLLAIALLFWAGVASAANDWPQFRGPNASGLDSSKALPVTWNVKSGDKIKWQAAIPGLGVYGKFVR
jgi:outer membrane protein assembly factor BamB